MYCNKSERTFLNVLGSGSMKFYAQQEIDELYRTMKQTPYEKKNQWQKFLNDDVSMLAKQRKDIRDYEVPLNKLDNYN